MSKEKLVVVKEAEITNNCPECFNQDMKITFKQKHLTGRLFDRVTKEVTYTILCKKCNSIIYPVNWTEDIERTFNYYQKMVTPEKPAIRFTSLFYIIVISILVLMGTAIYLWQSGIIRF
ncbi:hypothetical protein [Maribacter polysaccharolyticus]|uniref:hypothetical protein n=1 Tax=Maribacter polysaccharolyticus TaxID=3020831 RepID=UPI00237F7638|nr:hypothetical protein [Maribacter polysaccharolyticus]MDE3743020.1 hypothetical protein [Maribacter polysaccharolyticus]